MPTGRTSSVQSNCFTCQARARTEWCVLSQFDLQVIDKAKVSRDYLPGELIVLEGDSCTGIYCVESGMVGVRKSDANGSSILLYVLGPGETLGYRSLLADVPFQGDAEALEPSRVCHVDASAVRRLLESNPALGLRFLQRASRELNAADERTLQNATLSVRARFAHLLTVLMDRYGIENEDESIRLTLPLSRQDMASMIGTTPESMSRTIRKLEEDGVAQFSGRVVQVSERETLVHEFESPEII
jgi:CRP/FNR family transcriptional regulator, polysaccharide utilization system transcription regulator